MTAQFTKDQVSFVTPTNFSTAPSPTFVPSAPAARPSGLRAVMRWLSTAMQRQAVVEELNALSDHELADIGLTRHEIPRVFDRSFVAARSLPRAA